jgi:GntR family transcriptional regulator / MocR family aminotransferase
LNTRRDLLVPHLVLKRNVDEPLHRQIARQIEDAIRAGTLAGDAPLPSSRSLSKILRVSRNTVVAAYDELASVGLIRAIPGAGVRVNDAGAAYARF